MGAPVRRVYLSNGGAKSDLWKKIVVDVIGKPAEYVPSNPGSCLGAALTAMEATGITTRWSALERFLATRREIPFSPADHQRYNRFYRIYRDLYTQLSPLFAELASAAAEKE
jgi:xylulokinase